MSDEKRKRRADQGRQKHAEQRGKKLQSLADLSRMLPTEKELEQVFADFKTESDRGCALIAGSFLENTIALAINAFIADFGDAFKKQLHEGSDAPLGTFASKIKMGRALGIFDEKVQTRFETVKNIRNAFAHALRPLDFEHPSIVAAVRTLLPKAMPLEDTSMSPARKRYIAFCWSMGIKLYQLANEHGGKEMPIHMSIDDRMPARS